MGYIEGLLGGFTSRKREYEQEQIRQSDLANQREGKIYEALLQSPDPEIKSAAITGLLTSAQQPKRAGGLRGWIGDMAANPAMERIKALVGQPVETTETTSSTTLPSRQISGQLPQPTGAAPSLAQPETTPVTGGAVTPPQPAPQPISPAVGQPPAQATGVLQSTPSPGRTTTTSQVASRPREVFQSPEDATLARFSAQERGEILGVVSAYEAVGVSHEEAVQRAIEERQKGRGVSGAEFQSIAGQMPDGKGGMRPAFGVLDRRLGKYLDPNTRQPLEGFQPRTTVGSTSLGADRESIAREMFGKPAAQLTSAEMAQVNAILPERAGVRAGAVESGRGTAAADIPLSTQQRFQATKDLTDQWTKATVGRNEMRQQFSLMQSALNRYDADPIGGGQGVLVTFQKVLDPTSVVRESEYARSASGLALLDWLKGQYDRYFQKGGPAVPKPILEQMVKTAEAFLTDTNMQSAVENVRQRVQDTATSYQIDPRLVLGADYKAAAPAGGGAPAIGTPPPGGAPAGGGTGLDAPVAGLFVDAQGNLIRR